MSVLRRILRAIALLITCGTTVPIAVAGTVLASFLFLPLPAVLPQPKPVLESRPTHVHLLDGTEIAVFKDVEQKIEVHPEDIPPVVKKAVVAAEDRHFYEHGGVDIRGSFRAFWTDVHGGKVTQGGSTITQQYVKNVYTNKRRTLSRKVREAILASQVERQMDKDDILFKYLSTVYFGDQAYGIGAASETYFRKRVNDLTLSESAMLAGLIPAPSSWAPRENPDAAEFHRELVLKQMLDQKVITQAEYDAAIVQKVFLATQGAPPPNATVVFPVEQVPIKYPDFVDYVYRYLVAKYGPDKVLRGGLDVTVTLDPRLQDLATAAVSNMLKGTSPDLEESLVSVEPLSGFVKAIVGGREFGQGKYANVNFALGGCPPRPTDPKLQVVVPATCWDGDTIGGGGGGRQAGSSFKPFTLAAAFAKGITPAKTYPAPDCFAVPATKDKICNAADGEGGGSMNLRVATTKSVNTVFAQLIRDVGVKETAEMAKKLGITSNSYIAGRHGLSYTLGVEPVSPLDMASAYATFAGRGLRSAPLPVILVKDANGNVVEDNTKWTPTRVIDENVADNVTDLLRGPIGPGGTAYPRADIGRPAAGKTGTTDDYVDAWFVGYTPTLSTAVWMGYAANESTPMRRIKGVSTVFGGTLPAQTWHDFMLPALKDVPVTDFQQPAPIVPVTIDVNRQARGGIDPGFRRGVTDTGSGGPYVVTPPAPRVPAPTTTTTAPPADGSGGGGDGSGSGGDGTTTTTTTRPTIIPPRP